MHIGFLPVFLHCIGNKEKPIAQELLGYGDHVIINMYSIGNNACKNPGCLEHCCRQTGIPVMKRRHCIVQMGCCPYSIPESFHCFIKGGIAVTCCNHYSVIIQQFNDLRAAEFRCQCHHSDDSRGLRDNGFDILLDRRPDIFHDMSASAQRINEGPFYMQSEKCRMRILSRNLNDLPVNFHRISRDRDQKTCCSRTDYGACYGSQSFRCRIGGKEISAATGNLKIDESCRQVVPSAVDYFTFRGDRKGLCDGIDFITSDYQHLPFYRFSTCEYPGICKSK